MWQPDGWAQIRIGVLMPHADVGAESVRRNGSCAVNFRSACGGSSRHRQPADAPLNRTKRDPRRALRLQFLHQQGDSRYERRSSQVSRVVRTR